MDTYSYIGTAALLACTVRYLLGLSQGCLHIGRALSDSGSSTGFQDAVTPPLSTKATLLAWGLSGLLFVGAFLQHGIAVGLEVLGTFVVVLALVGGSLVPAPHSPHWVKVVGRSLKARVDAFRASGDVARAEAAEMLLQRLKERLGYALA